MKLRETCLFELSYQLRRVSTWLYMAVLAFFGFAQVVGGALPGARSGGYLLHAPFVIAQVTAFCCVIWLVAAAYVAGDAAARDVETGMHPLYYAAPVGRAEYLGGRFLAAFIVSCVILLAVPIGFWLGLHAPEVEAELRGPFQPVAYLAAYALIALPTAFLGTAVQFSVAALGRRAILSYVGGVLLLVVASAGIGGAAWLLEWELGPWLDPIGVMGMLADTPTTGWTPAELNTRLTWLEGPVFANRLLWIGVALATLAFTWSRFRFEHPKETAWWRRIGRPGSAASSLSAASPSSAELAVPAESLARAGPRPPEAIETLGGHATAVPRVTRTFDFGTRTRQTLAIAWEAFAKTVRTPTSLILLGVVALFAFASVAFPEQMGIPLVPRTDYVLLGLREPGFPPGYLVIPVLIVYWSGALMWREREAGLNEIVDATPVPDGVFFLGRFLGLGLLLMVCMGIRMAAGVLVQVIEGHLDIAIDSYLGQLFGLQLTEFLLLSLLALVLQSVANGKHIGHLVTIVALVLVIAGPEMGIPYLLAYGFDPGWAYTEMRGFGPSLGPWLWFQLYWVAWAALLVVVASLLRVRGREEGFVARLRTASRRSTPRTLGAAGVSAAVILAAGGIVFYNTNVLNANETPFEANERIAEYERRYGQFAAAHQPRLTGTSLEVEIHPRRRQVEIRGSYRLMNDESVPIDSIHLAPASDVETLGVDFGRPATLVLDDDDLGHRIYALGEPLRPGDSLELAFEVRFEPRGFPDSAVDESVADHGTYILSQEWLPAIGYQRGRELRSAVSRQAHGLPARAAVPSLYDMEARQYVSWVGHRIDFEAVVGTSEDQMAIAPGVLEESWTEGGRRYFRYSTDAPIGNEYVVASANFAMHEEPWNEVAIQIFHDQRHAGILDRVIRGARASLEHYTEQFGPYPYRYLRFVERAGPGVGLHADAGTITFREWFTLMDPENEPGLPDVPFAVVAHEVAHQWWGSQLGYALVEGAGVLSESLAWYSAIGSVEAALGRDEMRRLMTWMREPYPADPEDVPLLRAADDYLLYREGPFAMYALREYIGVEPVDAALRHLLETYGTGDPPLPTTLDLYRELRAVTPDSLQSLLADLFETNTSWAFETEEVRAEPTGAGAWQVTLDVRARKTVVDSVGVETEQPMDDLVQVGVFGPAGEGTETGTAGDPIPGEPIYLEMHRVRSGEQTITVTVPREPARAGLDPHHLLDWDEGANTRAVEVEG